MATRYDRREFLGRSAPWLPRRLERDYLPPTRFRGPGLRLCPKPLGIGRRWSGLRWDQPICFGGRQEKKSWIISSWLVPNTAWCL